MALEGRGVGCKGDWVLGRPMTGTGRAVGEGDTWAVEEAVLTVLTMGLLTGVNTSACSWLGCAMVLRGCGSGQVGWKKCVIRVGGRAGC